MSGWVLVTGGSRGIGRALVSSLSETMPVVFTWRGNELAASETLAECATQPYAVQGFRCDGSNIADVNNLAKDLIERLGAPCGIIHNAGIARDMLHIHQRPEDLSEVLNTNLCSVFHWNQALVSEMMSSKHGSIILMSSVTGLKGNVGQTLYGATKAAMMGVTRSLALELGRFNIRVNAIAPGFIATEMTEHMPASKLQDVKKSIPLRRMGTTKEVASLAKYLLSDESTYITGQTLVIDGGLSA